MEKLKGLQDPSSVLKEKHMRGQDQHKVTSATCFPLRYAQIKTCQKFRMQNTSMDDQSHTSMRSAKEDASRLHKQKAWHMRFFQRGSSSTKRRFTERLRPPLALACAKSQQPKNLYRDMSRELSSGCFARKTILPK